jgi:hypothetical protein
MGWLTKVVRNDSGAALGSRFAADGARMVADWLAERGEQAGARRPAGADPIAELTGQDLHVMAAPVKGCRCRWCAAAPRRFRPTSSVAVPRRFGSSLGRRLSELVVRPRRLHVIAMASGGATFVAASGSSAAALASLGLAGLVAGVPRAWIRYRPASDRAPHLLYGLDRLTSAGALEPRVAAAWWDRGAEDPGHVRAEVVRVLAELSPTGDDPGAIERAPAVGSATTDRSADWRAAMRSERDRAVSWSRARAEAMGELDELS